MVVDAQIDMAAVAGHAVALAKQLQPGHVHGNYRFRLELALEQVRIGKGIAGRDRVGAEHRCILVQSFQGIIQGAAAADGITVRVFVAQDQNVVADFRRWAICCTLNGSVIRCSILSARL